VHHRPSLGSAIASLFLVATLIFLIALLPSPSLSQLNVLGRWTEIPTPADTTKWWDVRGGESGHQLFRGGGTHLALLRGNRDALEVDTSWVLHFHDGMAARLWLATPMGVTTFGRDVPNIGNQPFCGGHAALKDGKLLVVGGTLGTGFTGLARAWAFDPKNYGPPNYGWFPKDNTFFGRWWS